MIVAVVVVVLNDVGYGIKPPTTCIVHLIRHSPTHSLLLLTTTSIHLHFLPQRKASFHFSDALEVLVIFL